LEKAREWAGSEAIEMRAEAMPMRRKGRGRRLLEREQWKGLGRGGLAAACGQAIALLLSHDAAFVTGGSMSR